MHFIMAGHIGLARANDRQVKGVADFEHLVRLPIAILPGINRAGKFAEIDFRVEISREPTAM